MANVGGEFGIGGLFNVARQEVQHYIYGRWKEFLPALKSTMKLLQDHQPPLLHAAIIAKALIHIICEIIILFENSILNTDRMGRYPIEIAFQNRLDWSEGLEQIVEAAAGLAHRQHSRIIKPAAQYGLK